MVKLSNYNHLENGVPDDLYERVRNHWNEKLARYHHGHNQRLEPVKHFMKFIPGEYKPTTQK
ncbi:hypothetical protein SAMN04488112_10680 [Melghirimyces thermohalophilus]|uniref:Uncharacterized protein n=1 Tax=Melghirimyces thermohalophilus TaxID=1236220 RepID=A0A1G6KNT6_9BACL|nr:hypothetical protein SAMN04488112_10680 [Melghirimyces thermohalophilus]